MTQVESWEERAKACLAAKPRLSLSEVEKLVKDGEAISDALPTLNTLRESAKKAKEWLTKSNELVKHPDHKPYIDVLEVLVQRGRPLPVKLGMFLLGLIYCILCRHGHPNQDSWYYAFIENL